MTLEEYVLNHKIKKVNIISSYHNHNYLCGHAGGTVEEFLAEAKKNHIPFFGISDHAPMPFAKDRMLIDAFYDKYLPQFENLDCGDVKLYKGLELEYKEGMNSYYQDLKKYVDYYILGQHVIWVNGIEKWVHGLNLEDIDFIAYKDTCIKALNTGLFELFAHPEIVFYNNEKISKKGLECLEELVVEAKKLHIPLEVNANGLRRKGHKNVRYRYPRQEYLDLLKKHNALCYVASDAHSPNCVYDEYVEILYSYLVEEGFNLSFNPLEKRI